MLTASKNDNKYCDNDVPTKRFQTSWKSASFVCIFSVGPDLKSIMWESKTMGKLLVVCACGWGAMLTIGLGFHLFSLVSLPSPRDALRSIELDYNRRRIDLHNN
jgi:hypothetical protein